MIDWQGIAEYLGLKTKKEVLEYTSKKFDSGKKASVFIGVSPTLYYNELRKAGLPVKKRGGPNAKPNPNSIRQKIFHMDKDWLKGHNVSDLMLRLQLSHTDGRYEYVREIRRITLK